MVNLSGWLRSAAEAAGGMVSKKLPISFCFPHTERDLNAPCRGAFQTIP